MILGKIQRSAVIFGMMPGTDQRIIRLQADGDSNGAAGIKLCAGRKIALNAVDHHALRDGVEGQPRFRIRVDQFQLQIILFSQVLHLLDGGGSGKIGHSCAVFDNEQLHTGNEFQSRTRSRLMPDHGAGCFVGRFDIGDLVANAPIFQGGRYRGHMGTLVVVQNSNFCRRRLFWVRQTKEHCQTHKDDRHDHKDPPGKTPLLFLILSGRRGSIVRIGIRAHCVDTVADFSLFDEPADAGAPLVAFCQGPKDPGDDGDKGDVHGQGAEAEEQTRTGLKALLAQDEPPGPGIHKQGLNKEACSRNTGQQEPDEHSGVDGFQHPFFICLAEVVILQPLGVFSAISSGHRGPSVSVLGYVKNSTIVPENQWIPQKNACTETVQAKIYTFCSQ